jgi:hypothetical protein
MSEADDDDAESGAVRGERYPPKNNRPLPLVAAHPYLLCL